MPFRFPSLASSAACLMPTFLVYKHFENKGKSSTHTRLRTIATKVFWRHSYGKTQPTTITYKAHLLENPAERQVVKHFLSKVQPVSKGLRLMPNRLMYLGLCTHPNYWKARSDHRFEGLKDRGKTYGYEITQRVKAFWWQHFADRGRILPNPCTDWSLKVCSKQKK